MKTYFAVAKVAALAVDAFSVFITVSLVAVAFVRINTLRMIKLKSLAALTAKTSNVIFANQITAVLYLRSTLVRVYAFSPQRSKPSLAFIFFVRKEVGYVYFLQSGQYNILLVLCNLHFITVKLTESDKLRSSTPEISILRWYIDHQPAEKDYKTTHYNRSTHHAHE